MRYNMDNDTVELTVEELCVSALALGDIDCRRSAPSYHEKASDHQRIYDKLHSTFGMTYYDRVGLSNTCKLDDVYFCVEGKADGILCLNGVYTVDEVRAVTGKRRFADRDLDGYHNARLFCYAYFLCCAKNTDSVRVRTVYYDTEEGEFILKKN